MSLLTFLFRTSKVSVMFIMVAGLVIGARGHTRRAVPRARR